MIIDGAKRNKEYMNFINTNKINIMPQLLLVTIFSVAPFIVQQNYGTVIPIMLVGIFGIYFLSPTVSFVYALLFLIDPMAKFGLSALSIVPLILCFLHFFLNIEKCLLILSKDRILKKIMGVCLLFSIYQLFVSFLLLSQQDIYYAFENSRYWLGIWILIPTYIFIIIDRNNFFVSITLVVLIIMVMYFLSFFAFFSFFEINEAFRYSQDDSLKRYFSFDLRQITKIFVYLLPLVLIFHLINGTTKILVIIIGVLVYLSVLFAVLRTEIVYLTMGAIISVYVTSKKIKANNFLKTFMWFFLCVIFILVLFPSIFETIIQIFDGLLSINDENLQDESKDQRLYVQLPVLLKIIEESPFFGGGTYSVSYKATGHQLLYDIPVLGAFGAYGIIGMLIYYSRFYYIFLRYKSLKMTQKLYDRFPFECLLTNALLAYFITMITFRTLHINIELAFNFGMSEFGVFIGVYFGLTKILIEDSLTIK